MIAKLIAKIIIIIFLLEIFYFFILNDEFCELLAIMATTMIMTTNLQNRYIWALNIKENMTVQIHYNMKTNSYKFERKLTVTHDV